MLRRGSMACAALCEPWKQRSAQVQDVLFDQAVLELAAGFFSGLLLTDAPLDGVSPWLTGAM